MFGGLEKHKCDNLFNILRLIYVRDTGINFMRKNSTKFMEQELEWLQSSCANK